jgi:hypothetical protein
MMPDGTPTNSFSARRAIAASSPRGTGAPARSAGVTSAGVTSAGVTSVRATSVRASAVAHSSAAEEDRPAPAGTSESMAIQAPGTW